jgi:hypothetical protein
MSLPEEGWSNPDGHPPMTSLPRPMIKPPTRPAAESEPVVESPEGEALGKLARIRELAAEALTQEHRLHLVQALTEIVQEVDR